MSLLSRLAISAARAYGILSSNPNNVSATVLTVGGGSGGTGGVAGVNYGAGGAGGILRTSNITISTLSSYTVAVGAGGAGVGTTTSGAGGTSSFTGATSATGGNALSNTSAAGASNADFAGGTGSGSSSGGGAGAGAVGGNASGSGGGNGGAGASSSISGSSVTYGGGGGGTGSSTNGSGGSGGGGAGNNAGNATSGTANTGGGGGGTQSVSTGGSGGSGIVIISYTSATPKFVGGTITTSGGKQIHTFTSSGTLSPITPITASYLVVAGGGAGGSVGGGGAGGLLTSSTTLYSGATYVVTIGAGAAGVAGTSGSAGSNSSVSGTGLTTITSTGGGGGSAESVAGSTGGSGGGGGGTAAVRAGLAGTPGQGYAGGNGADNGAGSIFAGGGGGGAGSVGSNASSSSVAGNGGSGTASSISGTSTTYAGGGGGGAYLNGGTGTAGTGGTGGGGNGGRNGLNATSGTTNTGGGGGANGYTSAGNLQGVAGSGGSGIVIISYAGSQVFNGGLVTTSGGNTIHTFTSSGALTPLTNNLNNSLRFRSSASAYLSRTPASAGNRKTWTFSTWVKRGALGASQTIFSATGANSDTTQNGLDFQANDTLRWTGYATAFRISTQVFRDPSAWYHIVVAFDSTQATATDRVKLYVNGSQITQFTTNNTITLNGDYAVNQATAHELGRFTTGGTSIGYLDAYQTEVNFIDGQALEPYYFGNNDANGVWKPIQYKGTYGTNGFYLTFGNTTSTTTLGYDSSPNGNNWTCNNISLTAGVTYDAMTDVPTNTSATVANYAVLNPLASGSAPSRANLGFNGAATGTRGSVAFPSNGLFYTELTLGSTASNATAIGFGLVTSTVATNSILYSVSNAWAIYGVNVTYLTRNGTVSSALSYTMTNGDVYQLAVDLANGRSWLGKNNSWYDGTTGTTGNPAAGTNPTFTSLPSELFLALYGDSGQIFDINFGQRPFAYTPPTGYVALNTYNLPTPTILQGNKYMDATLYTGNGSTQVIVNQAQFKPDFVWVKGRSGATDHAWYDSVRGTTKQLESNTQTAETTESTGLTAFGTNGFTVGALAQMNTSAATYVGWQWQAGQGSTTTGTGTGGITSVTQSVNTTAGFSIVTYTGSGSNGTVTHGLGVAPKMIIVRIRNGTTNNWRVYNSSLTSASYFLYLNGTQAEGSDSTLWNSTAPTSSVFSLGTNSDVNASTYNYVAYCWAEIAGFSKFGSYAGNGQTGTGGPFIYTGFKPAFVLIKKYAGQTDDWFIFDNKRNVYNVTENWLQPNTSSAETSNVYNKIDMLSNGFGIRVSNAAFGMNVSGTSFIYMAFAEHPFKNSNAR